MDYFIDVINGPEIGELFESLLHTIHNEECPLLIFKLIDGAVIEIKITSISYICEPGIRLKIGGQISKYIILNGAFDTLPVSISLDYYINPSGTNKLVFKSDKAYKYFVNRFELTPPF